MTLYDEDGDYLPPRIIANIADWLRAGGHVSERPRQWTAAHRQTVCRWLGDVGDVQTEQEAEADWLQAEQLEDGSALKADFMAMLRRICV